MQFNSWIFIGIFLPFVVIGYFSLNKYTNNKIASLYLLLCNCLFYVYAGIHYFLFFSLCIIMNYLFAFYLKKNKNIFVFAFSILVNIGLLAFLKYSNFLISSINTVFQTDYNLITLFIPLGLSFFIFQFITVLYDCYKDKISNLDGLTYLIYITYFPKIIQGPIMSYPQFEMQYQIQEKNLYNSENFANGLNLFLIGLVKKILVADVLAIFVNDGYAGSYLEMNSIMSILLVLSYTLQIYFDFSGYSDMALGVSYMLNIDLPRNFNSPYKAISVNDFWKRWHMSLTNFFTRYLYIPLGGNRKGEIRTYLNVIIVFAVSGLWHGANITYIVWGFLHGMFSVLERKIHFLTKCPKFVQWMYTFIVINVLWIFFRASSIEQALIIIRNILRFDFNGIDFVLLSKMVLPEITIVLNFLHLDVVLNILPLLFIFLLLCICIFCKNSQEIKKLNVLYTMILILLAAWCILSFGDKISFIYEMF